MGELTLSDEIARLFRFQPARKREPDELALQIAAATDAALHSPQAWLLAFNDDVSYRDQEMLQLLKLAIEGDDMQFGVRLANAIRRQVIHNATEKARDDYEEAHDTGAAA